VGQVKISKQDFIAAMKDTNLLQDTGINEYVDTSISCINALPCQFRSLLVPDTLGGVVITVPNPTAFMQIFQKYVKDNKYTYGSLPETSQWTSKLFEGCTMNDVPALERLKFLSTYSSEVSALIASNRIICILGALVGVSFIAFLVNQGKVSNLYCNAIKTRFISAPLYSYLFTNKNTKGNLILKTDGNVVYLFFKEYHFSLIKSKVVSMYYKVLLTFLKGNAAYGFQLMRSWLNRLWMSLLHLQLK